MAMPFQCITFRQHIAPTVVRANASSTALAISCYFASETHDCTYTPVFACIVYHDRCFQGVLFRCMNYAGLVPMPLPGISRVYIIAPFSNCTTAGTKCSFIGLCGVILRRSPCRFLYCPPPRFHGGIGIGIASIFVGRGQLQCPRGIFSVRLCASAAAT